MVAVRLLVQRQLEAVPVAGHLHEVLPVVVRDLGKFEYMNLSILINIVLHFINEYKYLSYKYY